MANLSVLSLAPTTVKRKQEANFHELLARVDFAPILVYSPGQDRGCMIPKLPIIELVMSIHIVKYGFGDQAAPANLDLERTREILLAFLQDATLENVLENPPKPTSYGRIDIQPEKTVCPDV